MRTHTNTERGDKFNEKSDYRHIMNADASIHTSAHWVVSVCLKVMWIIYPSQSPYINPVEQLLIRQHSRPPSSNEQISFLILQVEFAFSLNLLPKF